MNKWNIALLCWLAPLTDLKIGEVQPIEIYLLVIAPFFLLHMIRLGRIKLYSAELGDLLKSYFLMLMAILILSMFAMRLPVFPPFDLPLIKTPPFVSIARLLQLLLCVGAMIFLTMLLLRRPVLIRFFARAYAYSGLITASYAAVSWIAWKLIGVDLGGAYQVYEVSALRAKAFFVEGGPLGNYLVSVALVILFRHFVMRDGSRRLMWLQLGIVLFAEIVAASKAGILLSIVLFSFYEIVNRKVLRLIFAALVALPFIFMSGALNGVMGYASSISNFSDMIDLHSEDGNFAAGRIMGAIMLPRMIADHPIAGIGIGNYSLQRNNPDYLQGLPATTAWDLPGLGLLSYVAEVGIPLMLVLMWLLWAPVRLAGRRQVPALVVILTSYQFFANSLGVQITFAYPWLVTTLGLAYALNQPLKKAPKKVGKAVLSVNGLVLQEEA